MHVFSIHGCTGQLEVLLQNALNYESKSSYSVRVTVTDDGNPLQFDTSLITVAIVGSLAAVFGAILFGQSL